MAGINITVYQRNNLEYGYIKTKILDSMPDCLHQDTKRSKEIEVNEKDLEELQTATWEKLGEIIEEILIGKYEM